MIQSVVSFFERLRSLEDLANWLLRGADLFEDEVQSASNGAFWTLIALALTTVTTVVCAFINAPTPMAMNVAIWSVTWGVGPFVGFWVWRRGNRQAQKKTPSSPTTPPTNPQNPNEKPGNGLLEIVGLGGVTAIVGLCSTLVVATLCAVASYTHFHTRYVWSSLLAIGAAFVGWLFTDAGLDTLRDLGQLMVPNRAEGEALKARNRGVRAFTLVGVIHCIVMAWPVINYVVNYTDYRASEAIVFLYLALVGGFGITRLGTPGSGVAVVVAKLHEKFTWVNYETAHYALRGLGPLTLGVLMALDHCFLPPTPDAYGQLPSYAERYRDSSLQKAGVVLGVAAGENLIEAAEKLASEEKVPVPECSPELRAISNGLEESDCEVILLESTNPNLIRLCEQVDEACGDKGKPAPRGFPWGWAIGGAGGAFLLFLLWLFWPGQKNEVAGGGGGGGEGGHH